MKIGIGITTFNRPKSLKRLLQSIYAFPLPEKCDVVVAIDGNLSEDIEMAKKFPDIAIIGGDKNLGIPHNRNRILKFFHSHDVVVLIEDDNTILHPQWLEAYLKPLENGLQTLSFNRHSHLIPQTCPNENKNCIENNQAYIGGVPILLMVIHRNVLDKLGYFDENFGKYGRDHIDFGDRMVRSGLLKKGVFYDIPESYRYLHYTYEKSALPDLIRIPARTNARAIYKELSKNITERIWIDSSVAVNIVRDFNTDNVKLSTNGHISEHDSIESLLSRNEVDDGRGTKNLLIWMDDNSQKLDENVLKQFSDVVTIHAKKQGLTKLVNLKDRHFDAILVDSHFNKNAVIVKAGEKLLREHGLLVITGWPSKIFRSGKLKQCRGLKKSIIKRLVKLSSYMPETLQAFINKASYHCKPRNSLEDGLDTLTYEAICNAFIGFNDVKMCHKTQLTVLRKPEKSGLVVEKKSSYSPSITHR